MNILAEPFKQLVERKLWPIALLLVAGLVAVPMLLTKKADDTSGLPVATAALPAGQGDTDSVVSVSDAAKRDRLRAVLGDRKDPFRPAQVHHVKQDTTLTDAGTQTAVDNTASAGTGTGGGTTTAPVATPTPVPEPVFDTYSLKVRFGSTDTSGGLNTRNVKRLTGLPGGESPAVLYLGLTDDHKSAVFIVDAGVKPLGDGDCKPNPENCETLTLKKGQTEFFTRGDKQWELDLIGIYLKKTTDKSAVAKSNATIAKDGRQKLRGMISRIGSWSYDTSKGTVRRLPKAEQAKRIAKASRKAQLTSYTSSG